MLEQFVNPASRCLEEKHHPVGRGRTTLADCLHICKWLIDSLAPSGCCNLCNLFRVQFQGKMPRSPSLVAKRCTANLPPLAKTRAQALLGTASKSPPVKLMISGPSSGPAARGRPPLADRQRCCCQLTSHADTSTQQGTKHLPSFRDGF